MWDPNLAQDNPSHTKDNNKIKHINLNFFFFHLIIYILIRTKDEYHLFENVEILSLPLN